MRWRRRGISFKTVVVRFVMTGTHRAPILGLQSTGRQIRLSGMTILRFEGDHCIGRWSVTDSLALAVQIGAFPILQTFAPPAS